VRSRFKKWAEPFIDAHPEITLTIPFEDKSFFENASLYLEIGSGKEISSFPLQNAIQITITLPLKEMFHL